MSFTSSARLRLLSARPARCFSSTSRAAARLSDFKKLPTSSDTPVYLPLSSLLPRQPQAPRPSSQVVQLDPSVFSHPLRRDILHLCVVHHRDGLRQGSASTKNRAEVNYSKRKLRPQKGSGRARLGDRGSPMLRGGGRAFGPKPRDFSTKLPRKVREMGMRVALSSRLRDQAVNVVETLEWASPKTKDLAQRLAALRWPKVLFVSGGEVPELLRRTTTNLQGVECVSAEDLNIYDLLQAKRVVMDVAAVEWLEERFRRKGPEVETLTFATATV